MTYDSGCTLGKIQSHKAIPIKCFVSHRPPSREGGSVGRAKKIKINSCRVLSVSEGRAAKYESLVTWSFFFIIRWCNRNRATKRLKRLQKQSINDNLRQLVLMRQDHVLVN